MLNWKFNHVFIKNLYTVFFILSGTLFSSTVLSAIYKCTDSDGNLSFSDSPCPENSKAELLTRQKTNQTFQTKGWVADADTKITFIDAAAWWDQKKAD